MKTLTVRLPESLVAQIEAESQRRRMSKSDVVRERLQASRHPATSTALDGIGDLIASVDDLPADLSARRKHYLAQRGYGRKR